MKTRAEHIEWCKQRALAELAENSDSYGIGQAIASMTMDLAKHPETAADAAHGITGVASIGVELGYLEAMNGTGMRTADEVRRWIDGFA